MTSNDVVANERKTFWDFGQYSVIDTQVWFKMSAEERSAWKLMKAPILTWLEDVEDAKDDIDQTEWKAYVRFMRDEIIENLDHVLLPLAVAAQNNNWDLIPSKVFVLPSITLAIPTKRTVYALEDLNIVQPGTPQTGMSDIEEVDDFLDTSVHSAEMDDHDRILWHESAPSPTSPNSFSSV